MIQRSLGIIGKHGQKEIIWHFATIYSHYQIGLLAHFSLEIEVNYMKNCYDSFGLDSFIKQATRCKNLEIPTCIDSILTKTCRSFELTLVIQKGLPDFHSVILSIMRKVIKALQPKILKYRF